MIAIDMHRNNEDAIYSETSDVIGVTWNLYKKGDGFDVPIAMAFEYWANLE